ncbi:MAG TPA: hypothetical protein VL309_08020 [Vicinamibacterales bacterium]|jgi:hypothetical protein|nr:hypothetical protein [Vicinamibacterales bacterium]
MSRSVAGVCLALAGLISISCGSSAPAAPTPPPVPQLSGAWLGEQTLTSVTGAECLTPVLEGLIGVPSQFHASFTQSGQSVTATLDADHTGASCTYTGTIDGNTLLLTTTGCSDSRLVGFHCTADAVRDVRVKSETVRATINGDGSIGGTVTETDTIDVSGTATTVGTLVANGSFTLARQ